MKLKMTLAALAAMVAAPAMANSPATVSELISWEVGASYNFATKDIINWGDASGKKVHTLGTDVTGVYKIDANNAATLRLSYATGSASRRDSWVSADEDGFVYARGTDRMRYRLHSFTLMPGYRYTKQIDDKLSCFAGVNAGLVNASLKYKVSGDMVDNFTGAHFSYRDGSHGSEWGFAYSVELGASYAFTDKLGVFLAYQFSGSTARPKLHGGPDSVSAAQQIYHSVRAGVSCSF